MQSGSTHMRRRISTATRNTTEFLLFCSVLRRYKAWVEEPWTNSRMREWNIPKTQASTQTTIYIADDDTYANDYDMPDTYEQHYYL